MKNSSLQQLKWSSIAVTIAALLLAIGDYIMHGFISLLFIGTLMFAMFLLGIYADRARIGMPK